MVKKKKIVFCLFISLHYKTTTIISFGSYFLNNFLFWNKTYDQNIICMLRSSNYPLLCERWWRISDLLCQRDIPVVWGWHGCCRSSPSSLWTEIAWRPRWTACSQCPRQCLPAVGTQQRLRQQKGSHALTHLLLRTLHNTDREVVQTSQQVCSTCSTVRTGFYWCPEKGSWLAETIRRGIKSALT